MLIDWKHGTELLAPEASERRQVLIMDWFDLSEDDKDCIITIQSEASGALLCRSRNSLLVSRSLATVFVFDLCTSAFSFPGTPPLKRTLSPTNGKDKLYHSKCTYHACNFFMRAQGRCVTANLLRLASQ